MRSQFSIGIAFRPLFKTTQIEMLILQSVRQLVSHDGLLTLKIDPVSEKKLLLLRIEITRHLFC